MSWSAKSAVIAGPRRLSYGQLRAAAEAFAAQLRQRGAQPADRIALLLPNSAEAAVAIWGILEAGCVFVPLHAGLRGDALIQTLKDAEPRYVVVPKMLAAAHAAIRNAGIAAEVISEVPLEVTGDAVPAHSAAAAEASTRDTALAALIYTSGSTGEPKGVMLSHANMTAAIAMVNGYLKINERDILHSALPLSSSYGLYQLLLGLSVGATVVLDASFAFPVKCLESAARERATVMAAVPTMLGWMAQSPLVDNHDLGSLRIITSAAATLPPDHSLRLRERFPQARVFVMYGQTECKRISWLDPDDLPRHASSVGRGLEGQEHRVIDASGKDAAVDEPGELVVRGPHVMQGYWRREQETAARLGPLDDDGARWLHTGDLFRRDADGFLYFLGRMDEILKIGGHKVSPTEIEHVLCQMPGILEAAVIGVADAEWGEAAAAYLVPARDAGITEQDVKRHCSQRLRGFMVPRVIEFRSELPKTASGKILKRQLR